MSSFADAVQSILFYLARRPRRICIRVGGRFDNLRRSWPIPYSFFACAFRSLGLISATLTTHVSAGGPAGARHMTGRYIRCLLRAADAWRNFVAAGLDRGHPALGRQLPPGLHGTVGCCPLMCYYSVQRAFLWAIVSFNRLLLPRYQRIHPNAATTLITSGPYRLVRLRLHAVLRVVRAAARQRRALGSWLAQQSAPPALPCCCTVGSCSSVSACCYERFCRPSTALREDRTSARVPVIDLNSRHPCRLIPQREARTRIAATAIANAEPVRHRGASPQISRAEDREP